MPASRITAIAKVLSFRRASFLTLAIAVIAPAWWAYYQTREFEKAVPAPYCGMPLVAIWILAMAGIAVLCTCASVFNLVSFWRLASPRSRMRKLELVAFVLLALPALVIFSWTLLA